MAQKHPRKFTSIIIVAILILIQGILYLAATAWSFLVYKCRLIPNTQLGKVMHFIYFRDSACGEISWSTSTSSSDIILDSIQSTLIMRNVVPDMPNVTIVAFRTYILILAYGIISVLWVLTALMVLGSSCCSSAGRKIYHFCFTPWMIVVTLGCILDVIATSFHVYDIYYTTSAEKALRYLNVKNIDEMMTEIRNFSKLFTYPAIILTCITCRLIIFWLINIFGVFLASKQARKFMCHKSNTENSQYEHQVFPSQKDVQSDQRDVPSKEANSMYSRSSPNNENIRRDRKTFEPFKPTLSAVAYDNKHLYQDDDFSESRYRSGANKRRSDELNRYDDMSPIAYRKFQQHHPDPDQRLSLNSDRHRELPIPPIGYRFSLQNPTKDNRADRVEKRHGIDNVHITDELRGQLPWSYFNARDDITTPKRALTHHAEEHDVMPPVPVPDYTYHFPRKERPSIKSGDNEQHSHMTSSSSTKSNNLHHQSSNNRW